MHERAASVTISRESTITYPGSTRANRYKIYKYNGEKIYHPEMAEKLLCAMQADEESGFFRIEKYTKEVPTDVIPYLRKWMGVEKANLSPATYKDYLNSINNHLIPWFKKHPVQSA